MNSKFSNSLSIYIREETAKSTQQVQSNTTISTFAAERKNLFDEQEIEIDLKGNDDFTIPLASQKNKQDTEQ